METKKIKALIKASERFPFIETHLRIYFECLDMGLPEQFVIINEKCEKDYENYCKGEG